MAPKADIRAFSYIADDPELCEERFVDMAAARARARVVKTRLGAEELAADIDRLIHVQDEPFNSTSIYAQHRVMQLAREDGVTVLLDGQGADELLAGYTPYRLLRLRSLLQAGDRTGALRLGWAMLTGLGKAGPGTAMATAVIRGAQRRLGLLPDERPWLDRKWFAARPAVDDQGPAWPDASVSPLKARLWRDLTCGPLARLLRYEDRNAMAWSIESRVPFLTPNLAENLLLDSRGEAKTVFRRAMRGLVPDAILDRRDKIGFATPERRWFAALGPWIEQTIDLGRELAIPALNLDGLAATLRRDLSASRSFDFASWRCLNLIRWAAQKNVAFD